MYYWAGMEHAPHITVHFHSLVASPHGMWLCTNPTQGHILIWDGQHEIILVFLQKFRWKSEQFEIHAKHVGFRTMEHPLMMYCRGLSQNTKYTIATIITKIQTPAWRKRSLTHSPCNSSGAPILNVTNSRALHLLFTPNDIGLMRIFIAR